MTARISRNGIGRPSKGGRNALTGFQSVKDRARYQAGVRSEGMVLWMFGTVPRKGYSFADRGVGGAEAHGKTCAADRPEGAGRWKTSETNVEFQFRISKTERNSRKEAGNGMTILKALEDALELLESLGYMGGDIHDDLALAISRLRTKHAKTADDEL